MFCIDLFRNKKVVNKLREELLLLRQEVSHALDLVNCISNNSWKSQKLEIKSVLLNALYDLGNKIEEINNREKKRDWANQGLLKLNELFDLKSTTSEVDHFDEVLKFIVKYTGANQGAVFILNNSKPNDIHLERVSTYAYERKKYTETERVDVNSNLIGQCFLEGGQLYLKQVPNNYIKITSGLGEALPREIILLCLESDNVKVGVVELAFFKPLEEHVILFLKKACENVARDIVTIQESKRLNRLLLESSKLANQLKISEDELVKKINQMEQIQTEFKKQNKELNEAKLLLELKQEELKRQQLRDKQLLESKLKAQDDINQTIISRLKQNLEKIRQQNLPVNH